jgi:hypothetical protein
MRKPQEVLEEYLLGIDQVLENNPPKKEIKEIKRIRAMFYSSIEMINQGVITENNPKSSSYINAIVTALDEKIAFHVDQGKIKSEKLVKLHSNLNNLKVRYEKLKLKLPQQ